MSGSSVLLTDRERERNRKRNRERNRERNRKRKPRKQDLGRKASNRRKDQVGIPCFRTEPGLLTTARRADGWKM